LKTIGYFIFAGFYYFFRLLCPLKGKKVFGIMTHDGSKDGNVGAMIEYLKELNEGYSFQTIRNKDRKIKKNFHVVTGILSFFISKPYHLATSEFLLLDNVFLPMAYLRFRKSVKVIQLWHGTGTIKRFGQDVNVGKLKELEKRANQRITHLIVNSEETRKQYAKAFGVEETKVFVYGLPRTDLYFDKRKIQERKQRFYEQYPELIGKKLVLYAPTFRDQEKDHPKLALDTALFHNELSEEYVCLLRLHPFVMEAYERDQKEKPTDRLNNIVSMSSYPDINTLLLVSDYLITDYSSVIFEYCLREKPLIFYAYDLDKFSDHGRGFYLPYEQYVPGPVAEDTREVIRLINENKFDLDRIRSFTRKNYQYMDGKAAERIYRQIFKKKA
jgi:CDP-glycerol glycerophosphotransferase (TagB/SpsB family)